MIDPDEQVADLSATATPEQLRLALEAGQMGMWHWDISSGRVEWDEQLEALYGLEPGEFDGQPETWLQAVHLEDREDLATTLTTTQIAPGPFKVRHRTVWKDGSEHWLEGRGQATFGPDGELTGTIGCTHDITAIVHADDLQQAQIEHMARVADMERLSRERLEFLLRINDAFSSTTDRRQVMRRVAAAAVPRLGDWCLIHVLNPESGQPDIEVAHIDAGMVNTARQMAEQLGWNPDDPVGAAAVIRTGRTEFYPEIDVNRIPGANELARNALAAVGLHSSIIVPIQKRRRILGAITFAMTGQSRAYVDDDVVLAEAVAGRIASGLENVQLIEQQTEISRVLQASLLPVSLPEIAGFDVAVRYTPAGVGTEVGGDFYDAFAINPDAWGIAIGDVCGKGPGAAALTALARHTLRAAAWRDDDPSTVLARLNEAVFRSDSGSFCTAAFGLLKPKERTLRVAVGGHPLPILVHPDGRTETVGEPGLLLGVFPEPRSTNAAVDLPAGSFLVLYTDGVTDVPPPDELTPEDFEEIVGRCAREAESADHMASLLDETLDAIRPAIARSDDIALLILRAEE